MAERILIVGGGLAGLSAGIHARRAGFDVSVFEHHTEAGGVCTSWNRGGYVIDGCIEWLMGATPGHALHRLYRETGALDDAELIPLTSFVTFVDDSTGQSLEVARDLDRLLREVRAISPADAHVFEDLITAAFASLDFDGHTEGHIFSTLWDNRSAIGPFVRLLRPMQEVAASVTDPFLRRFLERILPGEMPAAFFPFILGELSAGRLASVKGGSQRFTRGMVRKLRELGGELHLGHDVEEVLVEDDRAIGVRLADGTVARGDHVISAAPGYTTIFRLLGGRYTDRKIRDRYTQWSTFHPICLVSFGAKTRWSRLPYAWSIALQDPIVVGARDVNHLHVRTFRDDPTLAPDGASVFQVILETDYDLWQDLHHAPRRYTERKLELSAAVARRLEQHLPGLSANIDMTDVATPYTYWRFARSWRGAYEGWLPTWKTLLNKPERTLPGLSRFSMAGQWVEPGGGVPTALMSGRQVIEDIVKEQKRTPEWEAVRSYT